MSAYPAYSIIAVKNADGTVQFQYYEGGFSASSGQASTNGFLKAVFNMSSANVTSLNTTVNGGSAGATLTFDYAGGDALSGLPVGNTAGDF